MSAMAMVRWLRRNRPERALFIRRTYSHLAGAILAFIALEAILLTAIAPYKEDVLSLFVGSRIGWLVVLVAFMAASWLAQYWARSQTSVALQYLGLGLYVVAEAVIFSASAHHRRVLHR